MARHTVSSKSSSPRPAVQTTVRGGGVGSNSDISKGGIKRPHRFRPGTVANREVRRYQTGKCSTDMLLKKTPLKRLVREIMGDVAMYSMKLSAGGFTNLHEACEDELVKVFQNAGDAAAHAGRITIFAKDMAFCEKVRKNHPNPVMGYKFNEHASGASPHSSVSTASRRRCGSGSRSSKKQVQKKPSGAGIEKTKKKHKHKSSKQPTSSLLQPPKAQKAPKPQPQQPLFQQMPRKAPRKMPIAAAVAVADDEESSHSSEIDMTQ